MSRPLRSRQIQDLLVDMLLFLTAAIVLLSQVGCAAGPHSESIMRVCRAADGLQVPTNPPTID
jgi:hypothetical protein